MKELESGDPRSLAAGRYALEGILGEGSMGRTYLALATEVDRRVAVKALYPSRLATVKDLELFMREADVLQKLSHPQIPAYIDAFAEGEGDATCYYLVQTWVKGRSLRDLIVEGTRWDEANVIDFARKLASILAYMHGTDPPVVHRDIKPDNIIVSESGEPTLVDFGAVREVVRLTMGGGSTIIGSYGYMPPEQLMGRAIPASDVYSMGVTLLEMLTRQTPQDLHGDDAKRLVEAANVSEALRRVLSRMVAPKLEDRYATADDFIVDLDRASGGGPLVHASALEAAIAEREKQREIALKRASTPGFIHLGYITLIALIVGSALYGIGFVVTTLAANFQAGFLFAGVLSGAGLFLTLILLSTRYIHDAWLPPSESWHVARGRITDISAGNALPGQHLNVGSGGRYEGTGTRITYTFEGKRGRHEYEFWTPKRVEDYELGSEFDVYYDPTNPSRHERADFVHDPHEAMTRLFDRRNVHTPE